ncbi:protein tramtrack, beta isoform-like isoform X2 [Pieris brassicae]|uniref:protein tramtrack, beta isoform-like isoform X2 n=1 Tax=Pieris brassicae TaxID=7116 RepID=UPI001E661A09|nr:protein tramtrack, beta isoform-like isoform X2 [Pieris brassicae]
MASDEQFSLCWNNFHANMSAGFHGLLSRGDLVDVTLAAEGRLLQAHKLVLSVCSPYFQEMFKMNPTQHPIVFLKDVSHSALRDLLQFMYQGEVNVKQEELATFISTAEQLQVKGLTGNQNEESSTPSKPKPTSRPGPRSSHQRQSVKLETELESKPSTPVAIKRTNRPSIASNNSSSSQSGPAKRKCIDPLEAGPSGSVKEDFVTIPDEDENNAVAPKMEPEFVNESMWDEDDDGANNDETNFGEDDSNMDMSGFDGSTTGDGTISAGGEGGAVGDAQEERCYDSAPEYLEDDHDVILFMESQSGRTIMQYDEYHYRKASESRYGERWICASTKKCAAYVTLNDSNEILTNSVCHDHPPTRQELKHETDDSDTAVVITSRKGKEMLLFRNYTYRRQYVKGNKSRWVCSTLKNCRAAVFTDSNNVIVSIQDKHEHDPPKYYLNPNHVLEALREPLVFESD